MCLLEKIQVSRKKKVVLEEKPTIEEEEVQEEGKTSPVASQLIKDQGLIKFAMSNTDFEECGTYVCIRTYMHSYIHTGTIRAPYRHHTGTIQAPYRHHTGTIQAPYGHHTGTIQAPYGHHTSTIQVLIFTNFACIRENSIVNMYFNHKYLVRYIAY